MMNRDRSSERKKTALYVEDGLDSRMLIPRFLQSLGWNVVDTVYQENFLEEAQQLLPDAIIFNRIWDTHQLDYCRQLKADKRTSHIPVVIIISYSQKITQEKAAEAGASICLTAPVDIDEFITIFETGLFT